MLDGLQPGDVEWLHSILDDHPHCGDVSAEPEAKRIFAALEKAQGMLPGDAAKHYEDGWRAAQKALAPAIPDDVRQMLRDAIESGYDRTSRDEELASKALAWLDSAHSEPDVWEALERWQSDVLIR